MGIQIDDKKMWESLMKDKCGLDSITVNDILNALAEQGYTTNDNNEIVSIESDKDYQWSGKIGKKESTGVLKEMLENLDEKELAKTMVEMMKESPDGELTEFEKELIGVCIDWAFTREGTVNGFAKEHSKKLMDIARKEFLSERYHDADHEELALILASRYKSSFGECGYDMADFDMIAAQDAEVALALCKKKVRAEFEKELDLAYKNQDEVIYNKGYDKGRDDARKEIISDLSDYLNDATDVLAPGDYIVGLKDALEKIKGE